jgi:hypothetical protein
MLNIEDIRKNMKKSRLEYIKMFEETYKDIVANISDDIWRISSDGNSEGTIHLTEVINRSFPINTFDNFDEYNKQDLKIRKFIDNICTYLNYSGFRTSKNFWASAEDKNIYFYDILVKWFD